MAAAAAQPVTPTPRFVASALRASPSAATTLAFNEQPIER
jgi:hypothetical protein